MAGGAQDHDPNCPLSHSPVWCQSGQFGNGVAWRSAGTSRNGWSGTG